MIEHKQTDCGRKIKALALAAFLVDGRNELVDRDALNISDAFEPIPEGVLNGHAGLQPVDPGVSFENQRFPDSGFCASGSRTSG
jgi:hypothetical protein